MSVVSKNPVPLLSAPSRKSEWGGGERAERGKGRGRVAASTRVCEEAGDKEDLEPRRLRRGGPEGRRGRRLHSELSAPSLRRWRSFVRLAWPFTGAADAFLKCGRLVSSLSSGFDLWNQA